MAETSLKQVMSRKTTYELQAVNNLPPQESPTDNERSLAEVLPREVVTDAMAKELIINLHDYSQDWTAGIVSYQDGEAGHWLSPRRHNRELVLQLRTNFDTRERCAWAELHNADGTTHRLPVRQRVMGEHPTLTVSKRVHVSPGIKHEAVELTVTPDGDTSQWSIRKIETSDGGRWWTVQPAIGIPLTGIQTLGVHLEAKPANVPSRSAVVTIETGTYPFNQTTDICLMQGVCFDYYIEYPPDDACTRHKDVIETPLGYLPGDKPKRYIIRVDSNQAWRLVKDIFIYQGGYVRIRGIVWMDRNLGETVATTLAETASLPQIAIPLGLSEEEKCHTWGTYYQFGKPTSEWRDETDTSTRNWNSGTEETPGKRTDIDPSAQGWRVPSVLELSVLLNRQASPVSDLLRGNGQDYLCLLSDDGVPFFLPLCGHLSHINGCRIGIPRGNRYWCGTSQSPIYGYSLCIEASRQMSLVHDMKKCGFPVRCVLDKEAGI